MISDSDNQSLNLWYDFSFTDPEITKEIPKAGHCFVKETQFNSKKFNNKEKIYKVLLKHNTQIMNDVYIWFSDIEKFIIPYNFRMVGLNLWNNNLFSGLAYCHLPFGHP